MKLIKSINENKNETKIVEEIKKYWNYEKSYLLMYKEFISRRETANKSYIEKNKSPYEKLKIMTENLISWLN